MRDVLLFVHVRARANVLLAFLLCGIQTQAVLARDFNIIDFGAVSDGKTMCTIAIQNTVDAAAASFVQNSTGFANVVVPEGKFLTGSFSLATGVMLKLSSNSMILASTEIADYPASGWDWDPALIDTHNASNTGIIGSGVIDGQALPLWVDHYDPHHGWIPKVWTGVYGCKGE